MRIKSAELKENTPETVLNSTKGMRQTASRQPESPAYVGENSAGDLKKSANLSSRMLEGLSSIMQNFRDVSLLDKIKKILDLLSPLKADSGQTEVTDLIDRIEVNMAYLKEGLAAKEFSPAFLRGILKLFLNSNDLKLNLLRLPSFLNNKAEAAALRAEVEDFVTYLETLYSFNQEGIRNISERTALLYFPFTVASDKDKDYKVELLVYPEFDEQQKVRQDAVSFGINVETERLGKVRMLFKVLRNDVSCGMTVESLSAQEIARENIDDLSDRLKSIKFILAHFDCKLAILQEDLGDYLFSVLPHLEVKA